MTHYFKCFIVRITILAVMICLTMGCGEEDDPLIITSNYLPIDVGNYWTFIEPNFPDDSGTIFITGKTQLSNGKTVYIVTTDEDDEGYLTQAANDLLLFHKTLNDLQGELLEGVS